MTYLTSALLGLIQGVAEFLPISSSGHLSLAQNLLGLFQEAENDLFFSVMLHLGTLIAVFIVYFRDIVEMVQDFFALFSRHTPARVHPSWGSRMVLLLVVATLPLLIVLPIKGPVENLYGSTVFVGCALLFTGCLLFFSDRMKKGRKSVRSTTLLDALLIGAGQALAVVPGLSRSGTTISIGLMRGMDRKFAVRFSFLLSIPAVLGATVLELVDAIKVGISPAMIPICLVGMAVAAVAGYFAIRLVNALAQKGKFGYFAFYCWGIGLITIIASLVTG